MWCPQESERARYVPSIFSLATLSRLLRCFNSGSAMFLFNPDSLVLSCLVLSWSSRFPVLFLPFYVLLCSSSSRISSLSLLPPSLPSTLGLSKPSLIFLFFCPPHTHTHTRTCTQTLPPPLRLELTPIFSPSLPSSLPPGYSREEPNLYGDDAAAAACAYTHSQ